MSAFALRSWIAVSALASLSACGGAGGGVGSTPTAPSPPSPPSAAGIGALAAPPAGVANSTNFQTMLAPSQSGDEVIVRWNAEAKVYQVQMPETTLAWIDQTSFSKMYGVAGGDVLQTDGAKLGYAIAIVPYSYTGRMEVGLNDGPGPQRYIAFGVATPAGAVPTVGTATYDADLVGRAGTSWGLYGTAEFQFDFAAGTLTGFMDPQTNGAMGSPAVGRYTFSETLFAPGSTAFSGSFDKGGSFAGVFTGPAAQELMANFSAPFMDWDSSGEPTVPATLEGVMIGKAR